MVVTNTLSSSLSGISSSITLYWPFDINFAVSTVFRIGFIIFCEINRLVIIAPIKAINPTTKKIVLSAFKKFKSFSV